MKHFSDEPGQASPDLPTYQAEYYNIIPAVKLSINARMMGISKTSGLHTMVQVQLSEAKPNSASAPKDSFESRKQMSARGKVPLYFRLAELLTRKIEAGAYKKGDLLPGEKHLASEYEVSLITVRAAMRILIDHGLVARYPGKGSFVLSQQQIRARWSLGSIDDLLMIGLKSKLVLLRKALIDPPEWVSQKYSYPQQTKFFWFCTVRVNNEERFFVTDVYHPMHIGEKLKNLNFRSAPIRNKLMITLVEEHCGLSLSRINQTMSAELASPDVARILGIKSREPILVIDRDYISTAGELIQVARSRYRVDHYRYTINVARGRATSEG